VNEDKTEVKRITPMQEPANVDERTVYVVSHYLKFQTLF